MVKLLSKQCISTNSNLFVRLLRLLLHSVERKVFVEAVAQVTIFPWIATIWAAFVQLPIVVYNFHKNK